MAVKSENDARGKHLNFKRVLGHFQPIWLVTFELFFVVYPCCPLMDKML